MKRNPLHHLLTALVVLLLAAGTSACTDNPISANEEADAETTDAAQVASDLSQELALSSSQQQDLQAAMDRQGERMREPGAFWYLAAELQATLTDEQKERLLSRAAEGTGLFGFGKPGHGGPGHGKPGSPGHGDCFAENVPDDVQEAIEAIRETYRPQIEALIESRRNGEITDEEFRTQREALHEAIKAEIDALISDDVQAAINACIEEERAAREAERAERQAAEQAAMVEALALSADQEAALLALIEDTRAEAEAIHEQVQDGTLDREAAREALQAVAEAAAAEAQSLLNATQWEIVLIHQALAARGGHHGPGGGRGPGGHGGPSGPVGG